MSPLTPILIFLGLGAALIAWGVLKRRKGARHGAGEALDAEAFARAGREQGNPLILVGAALIAITFIVWLTSR
jgi:hypothetical protein